MASEAEEKVNQFIRFLVQQTRLLRWSYLLPCVDRFPHHSIHRFREGGVGFVHWDGQKAESHLWDKISRFWDGDIFVLPSTTARSETNNFI